MKLKRLMIWAGIALVAAAVIDQLRLPAAERTWHGRIGGVVPYDFRVPTVESIRQAYWNPENPHLLTDRVLGAGWGVNLPRVADLVQQVAEIARA